jgi:integrase/recombinase XerD
LDEIRWNLYPRVAAHNHARSWVEIQRKLLRAPKTVDAYARGLDDYLRLCAQKDLHVEQATKSEIACYVEEMSTRAHKARADCKTIRPGLANRTILQRLTAVRLFYDYLMETGLRDTNPVGRGRYTPGTGFYGFRQRGLVRSYQRLPWIPSDPEWQRFLREVLAASVRNQLMISLAYDGALRRSELLSLSLADIDFSQQKITIRPEIAKCGTRRIVFYADATSDLLSAYIKHRHTMMSGYRISHNHPLFVSESRRNLCEPLTFEMWNKIVRAVALRAGLPHFTTHTFRHLRLTDLARGGLELHEIATYAGHRSLNTTLKYIHLGSQELGERVRRATQSLDKRHNAFFQCLRNASANEPR